MKKYLQAIKTGGAVAHIAYYADTPNKNYRIYYNGIDSGIRYEYLGNASRHLKRVAMVWRINGFPVTVHIYETRDEIPRRGSNA